MLSTALVVIAGARSYALATIVAAPAGSAYTASTPARRPAMMARIVSGCSRAKLRVVIPTDVVIGGRISRAAAMVR